MTGISSRISGLENLQKNHVQIVVTNHSSYVDSPLLGSVLPGRFYFVAKKEFQGTFLGYLMHRLGSVFVERFEAVAATKDTEEMDRASRAKKNLVVFPEGTFTRAAGLRPFHLGAFLAAARTGAPIIPVTIHGTRSLLRAGWWLPRRAKLWIKISPPIWPESSTWKEAIRIRDIARQEILRYCGEPDLGQ
jgi:1-acyl-sn-glycerol-3-phosphate acyltransferase